MAGVSFGLVMIAFSCLPARLTPLGSARLRVPGSRASAAPQLLEATISERADRSGSFRLFQASGAPEVQADGPALGWYCQGPGPSWEKLPGPEAGPEPKTPSAPDPRAHGGFLLKRSKAAGIFSSA